MMKTIRYSPKPEASCSIRMDATKATSKKERHKVEALTTISKILYFIMDCGSKAKWYKVLSSAQSTSLRASSRIVWHMDKGSCILNRNKSSTLANLKKVHTMTKMQYMRQKITSIRAVL